MKKPIKKPVSQKPNAEKEFFKALGIPPFKKQAPDDGVNKSDKK